MGGTDCALPMLWAARNKLNVAAFITYTDSETWAGNIHPAQALRQYRSECVADAKALVVGMSSNGFTLAEARSSNLRECRCKPCHADQPSLSELRLGRPIWNVNRPSAPGLGA